MTFLPGFGLPPDQAITNAERDRQIAKVAQHAEESRPNFLEDARAFVLRYLKEHGRTSGEVLTMECKRAGIVPHSDKAFGGVYMALSRRGLIVKDGTCQRMRGNNTAGGNIWKVVEAGQ
jgi:hypothetical protein